MRELVEFRISEKDAALHLPDVGVRIGCGVVKIEVSPADPLFYKIAQLHREYRSRGKFFFLYSAYRRNYLQREFEEAILFHVWPQKVFEPAGEECGTVYDDSKACPECGADAPQVTPLFLDGRHIPKKVDFSQTIAGEIVVTFRVVELFRTLGLCGLDVHPVRLTNKGEKPSEEFYQLKATGSLVDLNSSTQIGEDPFDENSFGRCPRGDLAGLNVFSEVKINKRSLTGGDILNTKQMVGCRRGLLRPRPLLLFSPKAWRAVKNTGLKGLIVEIAQVL